jgi:hypothetical protein
MIPVYSRFGLDRLDCILVHAIFITQTMSGQGIKDVGQGNPKIFS